MAVCTTDVGIRLAVFARFYSVAREELFSITPPNPLLGGLVSSPDAKRGGWSLLVFFVGRCNLSILIETQRISTP